MTAPTGLVTKLLDITFAARGATPADAKSAWIWLQQKGYVPALADALEITQEGNLQWTAEVTAICPGLSSPVYGRGQNGKKKVAEQTAIQHALRQYEREVWMTAYNEEISDDVGSARTQSSSTSSEDGITTSSNTRTSSRSSVSSDPIEVKVPPQLSPKQSMRVAEAQQHEQAIRFLSRKANGMPFSIIVSLDVEKYDAPHRQEILQLGIDIWFRHGQGQEGQPRRRLRAQLVAAEHHNNLINTNCPTDPLAFAHGRTYMMPEAKIMQYTAIIVQILLSEPTSVVVGHGIKQDIKWLEDWGQCLLEKSSTQLTVPNFDGVYTVDVDMLDRAQRRDYRSRKLSDIGGRYGVSFCGAAHNAGNDAVFTMETLLAMMEQLYGVKVDRCQVKQ